MKTWIGMSYNLTLVICNGNNLNFLYREEVN